MDISFDNGYRRRTGERKNYRKDVSFSSGAMIFPGVLKNISVQGACISSTDISRISKGLEIVIAIPYARKQGGTKRKGIVKWIADDRFGIQFARRVRERKSYRQRVFLSAGSILIDGVMTDISLNGACIHCAMTAEIKEGANVLVSIPYVKKPGGMKKKAVVKWVAADRFGILFI